MERKCLRCIKTFIEDGKTFWVVGKNYSVKMRDDKLEGWLIEDEFGQGYIYDSEFKDYFEWA